MQDKLQELTDRLYNEGLSKGKHDGEELVQKAQAEADRIIAQANKEAEELKTKVAADVKMAATQSIAVTKQEIEKMVVTKAATEGVKANMGNAAFVKELITSVVKAFNPQNASPVDLSLILPEALKAEVEPFVKNEIANQFKGEVKVAIVLSGSGAAFPASVPSLVPAPGPVAPAPSASAPSAARSALRRASSRSLQ